MHQPHPHPYQNAAGWTLLALALPLLVWFPFVAQQIGVVPTAPLFWSVAAQTFAVVVSMLVFITGYRAIFSVRKGAVVVLGVAFLGVGLLDFLHTMSDTGMPDAMTANTPQKSLFFWLAARMLAANALLAYTLLPTLPDITRQEKRFAVALMLAMAGALGLTGLLWSDHIPALFVQGHGPTPLKTALSWLVVVTHSATIVVVWRRRQALVHECAMALGFAAALSAVSELSELVATMRDMADENGVNVLGHIYTVAACLYLFHATFNEALRRPMQRLAAQHQRERLVLDVAPDGVLWVNQKGQILLANSAMETLCGYPPQALTGKNISLLLPPHIGARHAQSMKDFFTVPHSRAMDSMDVQLLRSDGEMLPVDISLGYWEDEGERHAIAYIRDLTERKKFEASLRNQATHDELTGLPNRRLFLLQLNQALESARHSGLRVAVLFLDLDYFKSINDSFGHTSGDTLLVQVGIRMRSALRESDTLARMGGDEFAILLTDLVSVDEAVGVATQLLASLETVYHLHDQDVYSGGSLGLAFYPDDATDSDALLRYADMALYQAKQAGRGAYACYCEAMERRVHEDMRLHALLKEAIAQGKLELHYQPLVSVMTGAVVGTEALLRWHDANLGDISPSRFIPIAEATGLILPLSDWVLETACAQIATWARAGTPLRVAVNLSMQQFRERNLPEKVRAALERTGAQAQWLDIEITESVAMTQPEQAREQLDALVALGCSVALDDFGTGYSSLAYLKVLPVSKLKIDKSFMDGIPHHANDVAISRAIIALTHSLGLTLVAEGVETDAQLAFLRQYGCEVYQGWLFAKAMKTADLTALLFATQAP